MIKIMLKILGYGFLVVVGLGILFVLVANLWIRYRAMNFVYDNIDDIPKREVGVVLGTSKYMRNGSENLFFVKRIEATVKLYEAGKIDKVIVSGDNATEFYNEPKDMKEALIAQGIPEDKIIEDSAGFRTLDSVFRAQKVFGVEQFTVITQGFQNNRAVFIGRNTGIDVIGYNAEDVPFSVGIHTYTREIFARVLAFLDVYVWKSDATVYGPKENI
jgi:SanA protein